MKLAEITLHNSRPINVLRFALAILGIFTVFSMQREQYPNVPLYYVHILVPYPGASAEEIEKEITQKVEKKTKELENISNITSIVSDGLSFTRVSYEQSLSSREFTSNYLELQSVISNMDLPSGAKVPIVDNFTYLDFMPIIGVVVYSTEDNGSATPELITQANIVKNTLERFDEVSTITDKGLFEKKIRIVLDKDKLDEYQMSLAEISNAIAQRNIRVPAGNLSTEDSVITIETDSNIQSPEELGETIIRATPLGAVYLSDIARINYHYNSKLVKMSFNGNNAVIFQLFKTQDSDSISLVKSVKDKLDTISKSLPEHIKIQTYADSTININNSISVLTSNALMGFIFLCLSLLLFLGWKPALISALEIPFTFATSFFVLKLLGITLNTSTLFALVLVLGMIVDHSIVILENIIRLRHFHNLKRFDSVVQGVSEVGLPVITSTLTTIGTFFPLIFMPGIIGDFLLPVPLTITVTLIISTISALIVIPIHYMEFPGTDSTHELKIFDWGRALLSATLDRILKQKWIICVLSLVIAAGSIVTFFYLPVSLYDTEDQPFFFVDVTMPQGSSIAKSDVEMQKFERAVLPFVYDGTIQNAVTAIGNTSIDPASGIKFNKPHNAQLQLEIAPEDWVANKLEGIIRQVDETIQAIEGDFSYTIRKQRTGPPSSPAIGYTILGDDLVQLQTIENRIIDRLQSYEELYNIKSDLEIDKPKIQVRIDEEAALSKGLDVATIGVMIRQWLSNDNITSVFINNVSAGVVASIGNISDEEKDNLEYISFPSNDGRLIPFSDVASLVELKTINSIYRENGKRIIRITADSNSRERIREINESVQGLFDKDLSIEYPGNFLQIGGEFDEFSDLVDDILLLLIIGIFIVYVILVAEFKSYSQPLLIMLTILFTTIGVSVYLLASKSALSITVLYAFVALVGVVVNGAIVLVSTANALKKKKNLTHLEAIKTASLQRFKPILLTSFTTIFGILPTALGLSGKSPIWQPMASTIVVGLFFSTMTTLIVIPAFYALLPNSGKQKHKQGDEDVFAY